MGINTEEFLNSTYEGVLDDHLDPCPQGDYLFLAGKPAVADFEYKSGEKKGETGFRMIIKWECQDEAVKQQLGRETVTVTQSLLLDVTPDGNGLDMGKGKNIGLGQIRTALGQNTPGQPWSPAMIEGQLAKLNIKHRVYEDRVLAEVAGVKSPSA